MPFILPIMMITTNYSIPTSQISLRHFIEYLDCKTKQQHFEFFNKIMFVQISMDWKKSIADWNDWQEKKKQMRFSHIARLVNFYLSMIGISFLASILHRWANRCRALPYVRHVDYQEPILVRWRWRSSPACDASVHVPVQSPIRRITSDLMQLILN